jgi:hypothetical protein
MTTDTHTEENHAISNARGWMESIKDWSALLLSSDDDIREAAQDEVYQSPLSVTVREGWKIPGGESELEEFQILLSTGGPALRIIGDIGAYGIARNPVIQWQDWGTPWTEYVTTEEEDEALLTYCQQFYLGE